MPYKNYLPSIRTAYDFEVAPELVMTVGVIIDTSYFPLVKVNTGSLDFGFWNGKTFLSFKSLREIEIF